MLFRSIGVRSANRGGRADRAVAAGEDERSVADDRADDDWSADHSNHNAGAARWVDQVRGDFVGAGRDFAGAVPEVSAADEDGGSDSHDADSADDDGGGSACSLVGANSGRKTIRKKNGQAPDASWPVFSFAEALKLSACGLWRR